MLVYFWADPSADEPAATPREGAAAARQRMWNTSFADYELWMREALADVAGPGGFDPANDIEAITINRWPHGYAYEYLRPNDPFWPEGPTPTEIGSKPFGRYAFANSDRAPRAWAHIAIEQAHRAVQELSAQRG
jgi:spermidine dehydrogenase